MSVKNGEPVINWLARAPLGEVIRPDPYDLEQASELELFGGAAVSPSRTSADALGSSGFLGRGSASS